MKFFKSFFMVGLSLLLIFGAFSTAFASEIRIYNDTRYNMSRVYVSPYNRSYSHQQNSRAIPSGKTFVLGNIPISSSNRYWNIKIILSNGKSREWKKVNLYSHREMTIYYSGSRLSAEWD